MFKKIHVFFRRLRTGSFVRMFESINLINSETHKAKIIIFFDMLWCIARYGVGYLDYRVFGFAEIKKDKRKTFMTMNDNLALVRKFNNPDYYSVFNSKDIFNKCFSKYIGRNYIDIRETNEEDFKHFCENKSSVFVKQTETFGGMGIDKIKFNNDTNYKTLYNQLKENKQWLVEDTIVQHDELNKICDKSVNTIRIVTFLNDDGAQFLYALLRMGNGTKDVDNITSGGLYTWIDNDGTLSKPAFCDKTKLYYDCHPSTGFVFKGFKIPYFNEAVELCKQAAKVEPNMKYIGWDIAITPDGPLIVEGNNLPSYDMCQNSHFHDDGCGVLPMFQSIVGNKF